MGIQFSPCNPCCSYTPTQTCFYTSPNQSLHNIFTIVDPDWMYQPDLVVPSNFKLTHFGTSFASFGGGFKQNPNPWDVCDLQWVEANERFEGVLNPSPTDDLGLTMVAYGTICRLQAGGQDYNGLPFYGVKITAYAPNMINGYSILMLTRTAHWVDKMWTASSMNNCYLCSRETWKAARRDKYHRFLWMLPECYKVDRSQWAGFTVPPNPNTLPTSTVYTGQHWYNNMYPSWWAAPLYYDYQNGYCWMSPGADQMYLQGSYYYGFRWYYQPPPVIGTAYRYFDFEGDNELEFLSQHDAYIPPWSNPPPPPTQSWNFERWEY